MAMSWRPKTASAFATFGLARRVVNVLSTYPGATLTKMTLVPNSSLGIQNSFVSPDKALALKDTCRTRPRSTTCGRFTFANRPEMVNHRVGRSHGESPSEYEI